MRCAFDTKLVGTTLDGTFIAIRTTLHDHVQLFEVRIGSVRSTKPIWTAHARAYIGIILYSIAARVRETESETRESGQSGQWGGRNKTGNESEIIFVHPRRSDFAPLARVALCAPRSV